MTARLYGGDAPRLGLRQAAAAYAQERRRAGWRPTFVLLRQERHWSSGKPQTEAEQVRLKAVRDELRSRHVALPPPRCDDA